MLNTVDTTQAEIPSSLAKVKPEETRRMKIWLDERIAAGKKKRSAEVVTLTPVLAALLLERNPVNRNLSKLNLESLRSDVAESRFQFNGESIVISNKGTLIDGQHRCQVVVTSGVAIETVIVFGPEESARYTIDIGKPKTAPNFLHMKGWTDTNKLAAALSMLIYYRKHDRIDHGFVRPTKTEIIDAIESNKGVHESVTFASRGSHRKLGSHSILAFCHYVLWKRAGRHLADEFFEGIISGDGLRRGSPIYYCRERLGDMDRKSYPEHRVELIFKCWNAWRRGEKINHLKLSGVTPKIER